MENPFIKISKNGTKHISQQSSINRLIMKKVPIKGIDDSIEGQTFEEIFSLNTFLKVMNNNKKELNILCESITPQHTNYLIELTKSDDKILSKKAEDIIKFFGYRLGLIFLSLKIGDKENREANKNFTDDMWDYFSLQKDILLVGGMVSGEIGEKLLKYVLEIFKMANITPYNFILFENASLVGVMGCVSEIKEKNCTSLVLDMGHTNIKRLLVTKKNGEFSSLKELPTVKSKYVFKHNIENKDDIKKAKELHNYILNTVVDAYKSGQVLAQLSNTIIISIANYVVDGVLDNSRGGYAKLSKLGVNYAEVLEEELSGRLKREIKVKLIHDATAVAKYFSDYKNAVCITLGTAFGISFTDIN